MPEVSDFVVWASCQFSVTQERRDQAFEDLDLGFEFSAASFFCDVAFDQMEHIEGGAGRG